MDEFAAHLSRITRTTLFILSATLVLWAFWIDLRPYFAGFILGGAVSLLNSHYTAWKIKQLGDLALKQSNKKRVNLGFITRASTSLLAVLLALKASDIEFSTTLAGLFITQIISLGAGIYINIKYKGGR
jgi:ATP synthase protein I